MMKMNYPRLLLASLGLMASILLSACGDNPSVGISTPSFQWASEIQTNISVQSSYALANPNATQISLYDDQGNIVAKGGFQNNCIITQYAAYVVTSDSGPFDNTSCNASTSLGGITFSQTLNKSYEASSFGGKAPHTNGSISYTLNTQALQNFQSNTGSKLGKIAFDVLATDDTPNKYYDSKAIQINYDNNIYMAGSKKGDEWASFYAYYYMNPATAADYVRKWTLSTGGTLLAQGSTTCPGFDTIKQQCNSNPSPSFYIKVKIPSGNYGVYILTITTSNPKFSTPTVSGSTTINFTP